MTIYFNNYNPIPDLNVIQNQPQTKVVKDPHLNEIPLSGKVLDLLLKRGDQIFAELSETKNCKGITAELLNVAMKNSPNASSAGKFLCKRVGTTFGAPVVNGIISTIWDAMMPKSKAKSSWLDLASDLGKGTAQVAFTSKVAPYVTAASGAVGGVALPVVYAAAVGTYKWATGANEKVIPTLENLSKVDQHIHYDETTKTYYNSENEPLTSRDINKRAKLMREYQLICDLLLINRGDVESRIKDGLDGLPKNQDKSKDCNKKISKLIKCLRDTEITSSDKKDIKKGLKIAAKFCTVKGPVLGIQQENVQKASESLSKIQELLSAPSEAKGLNYDVVTGKLVANHGGISGWWYGQSATDLSKMIKDKMADKVAKEFATLIDNVSSKKTLNRLEARLLNDKINDLRSGMHTFFDNVEVASKNYSDADGKLINAAILNLCDDIDKNLLVVQTIVAERAEANIVATEAKAI